MLRSGWIEIGLISYLILGDTKTEDPPESKAAPLAAILEASEDYHLEQHPDPTCRPAWRKGGLELSSADQEASERRVVQEARLYLGEKYRYGGTDGKGLDCSALVNKIYMRFGYDLPRSSKDQFEVGVKVKRRSRLRPGDLVFFTSKPGRGQVSHVGVYIGGDQMLHASSGRRRVLIDDLNMKYYEERFAGGRRLLTLPPGRYSGSYGQAPKGLLFKSVKEARKNLPQDAEGPCQEKSWE